MAEMMGSGPVIVVTGTLREGAVLAGNHVEVLSGGSDPEALRRKLEAVAGNCAGIVSFGMAGGIDPSLKLGSVVIGKRLTGAFPATCDENWVAALRRLLPRAKVGAVYCDGKLLADVRDKEQMAWASAALCADMESHIAAEVAARANVPFAILRCISDVAQLQLPPAVDFAMRADGGVDVGAVIRSIMSEPGQLPALATTVYGFARAYRSLIKASKLAGDRLAFDLR